MLNGNTVATLTFNQLQTRNQQTQNGSMFGQLYQYQQHMDDTSVLSRGRLPVSSTAGSS
jgi:hypothetical protein